MGDERTPEEVAGGFLRCHVGTSTRDMPTLKMADERGWRLLLGQHLNGIAETDVGEADFNDFGNPATLRVLGQFINLPADTILDLVVAYDKTEALGGKEWLVQNADSEQVWVVLRRAFKVVFPFVTGAGSLISTLATLRAMSQNTPELTPTNGLSPTGTEVPATLKAI